jgi:L-asparaginase II
VAPAEILHGVDGCTAVSFGLSLHGMATAYARFGASPEAAPTRLREAMMHHPFLVAGTGRFCTELMSAMPGDIISKVGAEGVYSVALPKQGIGIALKVEDGDGRCAPVALYGVLRAVLPVFGLDSSPLAPLEVRGAEPIINTRGEVTGVLRCTGAPRFLA